MPTAQQAYVQVTTTTDSRQEAADLARGAVEARLAACAQLVGPISSTYWWEGEIESAQEWMVIFKTTVDRFEDLAALIVEEHSYDTPEIIATSVAAGSADYLAWVSEQTAADPEGADEDADADDDADDDLDVDDDVDGVDIDEDEADLAGEPDRR